MNTDERRREEREELVRQVQAASGLDDPRILAAFLKVPREAFVPEELSESAYDDRALPIGEHQTISQPSMIALMLAALEPVATDRALEVGAGSGYASALLAEVVESVLAIELIPALAERARRTLARLAVTNVEVELGDGTERALGRGPFDVILVSAGAREVPEALVRELGPGGRIAIPVGDEDGQHLYAGRRGPDGVMTWERRTPCLFVPLVGS